MRNPQGFPGELEFGATRLEAYLRAHIPGLSGQMRLQRIGGGQSNPTFFVDFDYRCLVLRKKPAGVLLPSAHAVDREYRVMKALAGTDVPVPKMVLFEPEPDIVGTPFYLMDKLEGRVFAEYSIPGVTPEHRHAMYLSMADTMARLHAVDWNNIGLGDYGKPGNYFNRQVVRWTRQWQESKTRENPWLDTLIVWLPAHIPAGDETTICHGDLRLGNLMFHPTEPRVIALLDWELSTLGHPLADVSFNCLAWHAMPSEYGGIHGLDYAALGIPSEAEYLAHYYRSSDRGSTADNTVSVFHYAFSLFRFAVIFEGIAARASAGTAASENAEEVGALGAVFARRAVEITEGAD